MTSAPERTLTAATASDAVTAPLCDGRAVTAVLAMALPAASGTMSKAAWGVTAFVVPASRVPLSTVLTSPRLPKGMVDTLSACVCRIQR